MLTSTTVSAQVAAARDDRLRVLVVGAGVAGLTLTQLLRRQGLHPVLVERAGPDDAEGGYMLALMPLVDPVISRLGVDEDYHDRSEALHRYRVHGRSGACLREYSLDGLLAQFGDYRGIERGQLLRVIASGGAPVSFGTTVTELEQTLDTVRVHLQDEVGAREAEFDVVVAADGLHSTTRELVLSPDQVDTYDTGWGGWVAWADPDYEPDLSEETWGAGFFVGTYPVQGRVGVFVGGNRQDTAGGPRQFLARVRGDLQTVDERRERALTTVETDWGMYYWSLTDVRCTTWSVGRVALLGDAAVGFLPTAGVGAAIAMESAGVLAQRLGEATRASVPEALCGYERAQRPRAESAQDNSRWLAWLMFHRSSILAAVRDVVIRFATLTMALGPIRRLLETSVHPS
jgi:salicylate hydroxylase